MKSHAVNGWRALLFNEYYFLYDQVNFDININLYIRLWSDLKEIRWLIVSIIVTVSIVDPAYV